MRHTLYSFVAVLCLLAFMVSSAVCLAPALPSPHAMGMHRMGAQEHACCPRHEPVDTTASNSCCTLHHQPAAFNSVVEAHQITLAFLPLTGVIPAVVSHAAKHERLKPVSAQLPPLIALRI
jgi:hypothetical protein